MSYIVSFDKISDEELKLAGGKGSRFIKGDDIDAGYFFQGLSAFD